MAIISRFAKGFLDLLGVQNFGENPRQLSDVVLPVVDIGNQYQVELLRPQATAIADILVGFNAVHTVPAGEVWCLKQGHAGVVTDAGEAFAGGLAVSIEGNAYSLGPLMTIGASSVNWSVSMFQDLWLPAGAAIGVFCQSKTGTVNGTVTSMTTRLRA